MKRILIFFVVLLLVLQVGCNSKRTETTGEAQKEKLMFSLGHGILFALNSGMLYGWSERNIDDSYLIDRNGENLQENPVMFIIRI